jgi:hypothetical protein
MNERFRLLAAVVLLSSGGLAAAAPAVLPAAKLQAYLDAY